LAECDQFVEQRSLVIAECCAVDDEDLGVVVAVVFVEFGSGGGDRVGVVGSVEFKHLSGGGDRAFDGRVGPDSVAEVGGVDVQADEADVDGDAEWSGGEFECHRSGETECGFSIADDRDACCGFEVEEHFVAVVVGSGSNGDECWSEELSGGFGYVVVESVGPGSSAVDARPAVRGCRGGCGEKEFEAVGAELDSSDRWWCGEHAGVGRELA
jgi:hypothetical protein